MFSWVVERSAEPNSICISLFLVPAQPQKRRWTFSELEQMYDGSEMKINNEVSIAENFLKYRYLTEHVFNKPFWRFFVSMLLHITLQICFFTKSCISKTIICMQYNNQQKCIFVQSWHRGLGFGCLHSVPSALPFYIFPLVCRTKIKKG